MLFKYLIILTAILASSLAKAEQPVVVAGPEWKGFVNQDGSGVYLDLLSPILLCHKQIEVST